MFTRPSSISKALAVALLADTPMPLPSIDTVRIYPFYPSGGWSGSFRGKRPAGMTKAQRTKKRKAQRLERQRLGAGRPLGTRSKPVIRTYPDAPPQPRC